MKTPKQPTNDSAKQKKANRPSLPKPKGPAPILDIALIKQIAKVVRQNCRLETAASAAGVTKRRLMFWMEQGAKAIRDGIKNKRDKLYVRFVDEMQRAMDIAENKCITGIKRAGEEDWKALAWIVAHSPATKEAYAPVIERKSKVEGQINHDHVHDHQHTGTVTLTGEALNTMSLEQKKQLLEIIKKQKEQEQNKPLALPSP